MIIVVGFLVGDRAPIVVRFSVIVIFVIVAGHVEWSGRSEQGGRSTRLCCNVIVEGGRWISVLCGASRLLEAVSHVGSGFQSGVSMLCWQSRCRWPVFDRLCGGERTHSHHQDGGGLGPPRAGIGSGAGMRRSDVV